MIKNKWEYELWLWWWIKCKDCDFFVWAWKLNREWMQNKVHEHYWDTYHTEYLMAGRYRLVENREEEEERRREMTENDSKNYWKDVRAERNLQKLDEDFDDRNENEIWMKESQDAQIKRLEEAREQRQK